MLSHSSSNLGFRLGSASLRFTGALTQRTHKPSNARNQLPLSIKSPDTQDSADAHPDQLAHLEAVLFLSSQPLPSRKLAQLSHLADGTAARTMVGELNTLYENTGRSFRVEEVAGGYQLRTQKIFAPWIRKIVSVPLEIRMSGPAMETLAVVAYRQPVMRTDIEKVRGVQCGEILRQLMERGMVRISGRADELGRPFLYGTTRNFLEVFGLRSLDELPRASMLRTIEDSSDHGPIAEEDTEVSVCDATGQSESGQDQETLNEVLVAATEDEEFEDDEFEDGDDDFEDDDEDDDEDEDEDDGFNDEEWEEVKDEDDLKDDEEEWDDEEEDTWDDDEDWDDDD